MPGLMQGKRGLVMGVANNRSIAWGIAKACHGAGAELAFTYQGDALKKRVEPLAEEVGGLLTLKLSSLAGTIPFALMLLILLVRPSGLMGEKE